MRIGVVSDSHNNLFMLNKAVADMGKLDLLLHLGDHFNDIIKLNAKYHYIIDYIAGNNDYIGIVKSEKLIEAQGKRIFLTHGHKYNVNFGLMTLAYKAEEEHADIVLYGHTHRYSIEHVNNILFVNPGSVSRPRDRHASAAVIDISSSGDIHVQKNIIVY